MSSVTRALYVQKALRVAEILAPEPDFAWLREIANERAQEARPRPKHHRLVTAE